MNRKCIYCDTSADLSESDIIPDALTNARILNKNVCRIAHNNKFSDSFESDVISALSFITNELDIKSHKGKQYASYDATVTIEGEVYNTSLRSDKAIFDERVLKSEDKKYMISSYEKIVKIARDPSLVQSLDVNRIEIEKNVKINTPIFFNVSMFRMIAKIAYEWYCAKNDVLGYHHEFERIVSYITTGTGECPVSIIQEAALYKYASNQLNLGSHTLFAYEATNGQIEVVVFLFGIFMYRVIVAAKRPVFCLKNFLFIELKTDSSRREVEHESLSAAEAYFRECLNPNKYKVGAYVGEIKIMIPRSFDDFPDITIYPFIFDMIKCFDKIREDTICPNETVNNIFLKQIQQITQASLLHKKSIKRFVNDYFSDGHEPIKLNPEASNKKAIVLFYIVFMIGKSGIEKLYDSTFQHLIKKAFALNGNTNFTVTDELAQQLKKKIFVNPNYSDILEQGANIIKSWV